MKKSSLLLVCTLLLGGPAFGQDTLLALLFESEPGTRPAAILNDGGTLALRDASGDGTPDLLLLRYDEMGNPKRLRVLDGHTREVLLEVSDLPATLGVAEIQAFAGFADLLDTGMPQALFVVPGACAAGSSEVRLVDPRDWATIWSECFEERTLGLFIIYGDPPHSGIANQLVIALPETQQVQVWGKPE